MHTTSIQRHERFLIMPDDNRLSVACQLMLCTVYIANQVCIPYIVWQYPAFQLNIGILFLVSIMVCRQSYVTLINHHCRVGSKSSVIVCHCFTILVRRSPWLPTLLRKGRRQAMCHVYLQHRHRCRLPTRLSTFAMHAKMRYLQQICTSTMTVAA